MAGFFLLGLQGGILKYSIDLYQELCPFEHTKQSFRKQSEACLALADMLAAALSSWLVHTRDKTDTYAFVQVLGFSSVAYLLSVFMLSPVKAADRKEATKLITLLKSDIRLELQAKSLLSMEQWENLKNAPPDFQMCLLVQIGMFLQWWLLGLAIGVLGFQEKRELCWPVLAGLFVGFAFVTLPIQNRFEDKHRFMAILACALIGSSMFYLQDSRGATVAGLFLVFIEVQLQQQLTSRVMSQFTRTLFEHWRDLWFSQFTGLAIGLSWTLLTLPLS